MRQLDAISVIDYLRQHGRLAPGEAASARALEGGVSNTVLRVDADGGSLVLKQSLPQLRTRAAWFSDVRRIFREAEVMRLLGRLLPEPTVPRVLFEDRDLYAFAMSAAPADHRVWKQMLLAGDADPRFGRLAGETLGAIHACTAGDEDAARRFDDREVFIQLRVEPFYWRSAPEHPELRTTVAAIVAEMFRTRLCLTHADFSPKNLLVHGGVFTLVDYETAHWGDPAFDLGFFLSHLLLKAIKCRDERARFFELTRAFWQGYRGAIAKITDRAAAWGPEPLMRRTIGHLGLCLIARIDGTSPVDYLNDEADRAAARCLAKRLLREPPGAWDAVLAATERATAAATLAAP